MENFWYCTESIKKTLYLTLVRPKLDYAAVAWDPHFKCDIVRLEGVQRVSACFYTNDYNWFSSVTSMLNKLDLCTLKERRKRSRLIFMYKIIPNLVNVKINVFFFLHFSNETRTKNSHRLKVARLDFLGGTEKDSVRCVVLPNLFESRNQ